MILNKEDLLQKPLFARITADITCDGHLQLSGWRGLVSFYSKNKYEIDSEEKRFFKLFKIKGHVYTDKRAMRGGYKLFFTSKSLAQFLSEIGVPAGNKTNVSFLIPKWIFNGDRKLKQAYLRGVYDSEGCISATRQRKGKPRWRITLEMYKNKKLKENGILFMNQIRTLLSQFGIKSSPVRLRKGNKRKDGTTSIGLLFDIEISSFRNFYKYVGFNNIVKQEKLKRVVAGDYNP